MFNDCINLEALELSISRHDIKHKHNVNCYGIDRYELKI